jgi:hypothetical protein
MHTPAHPLDQLLDAWAQARWLPDADTNGTARPSSW